MRSFGGEATSTRMANTTLGSRTRRHRRRQPQLFRADHCQRRFPPAASGSHTVSVCPPPQLHPPAERRSAAGGITWYRPAGTPERPPTDCPVSLMEVVDKRADFARGVCWEGGKRLRWQAGPQGKALASRRKAVGKEAKGSVYGSVTGPKRETNSSKQSSTAASCRSARKGGVLATKAA